jgi:spore maturation protein A
MNLSANLLGLGNAATPLGLSAMKEMKKIGANSHMIVFTVLNTASFQLIPSTMIAMRSAAGAKNPSEILVPVWCASVCSVVIAVMCAKIFSRSKHE